MTPRSSIPAQLGSTAAVRFIDNVATQAYPSIRSLVGLGFILCY
jgi:hypothetical protein